MRVGKGQKKCHVLFEWPLISVVMLEFFKTFNYIVIFLTKQNLAKGSFLSSAFVRAMKCCDLLALEAMVKK